MRNIPGTVLRLKVKVWVKVSFRVSISACAVIESKLMKHQVDV